MIRFGAAPLSTVSSYWSVEEGRGVKQKNRTRLSCRIEVVTRCVAIGMSVDRSLRDWAQSCCDDTTGPIPG